MGSGPPALAQERPGSVLFLAGVVLTDQAGPTGEVHETYVTAPGGTTSGWLLGGGVALARRVSIEAEWSRTGIMTAREPSRYNTTFNEARRDRFATVALRFSFPLTAAVRLEPVAGLVLTSPQAWSQSEQYTYAPTPQQTLVVEPRLEHRLDSRVGPALGCDVRLGGRHLALVPSFRAANTGVSHGSYGGSAYRSDIGSIYPGGYPKWTLRGSLALRVGF